MVNTPSIRFCCCDFGSAATARSSRGIASAYFADSNDLTALRYGSAHRLFCAYAAVLATTSTNEATRRPILMNSPVYSRSPQPETADCRLFTCQNLIAVDRTNSFPKTYA